MDIFGATMLAEGAFELAGFSEDEVDEELMLTAWQLLIDTGTCWQLQGFFGRTAQALIEQGLCSPAGAAA